MQMECEDRINKEILAKRFEHYETPEWAVRQILNKEILTKNVVDPCTGTGILADVARVYGYNVAAYDIYDWGYEDLNELVDFLSLTFDSARAFRAGGEYTILMNPPFSKACKFVEKAFELGARKVVCFQRLSWLESQGRKDFWKKYSPNRVYVCGNRATCWLHSIDSRERGERGSSTTAHAWFVFEPSHPCGTLTDMIYKLNDNQNQTKGE